MLKINIDAVKLDTEERRLKAHLVADEMQLIINSDIFREKFLAIDNLSGEFSAFKAWTITELYKYFMDGSEILTPEFDGEIDLEIDDYYAPSSAVGKTYPGRPTVFVNTKFFDSRTSKLVGSNFTHEYGHKKGFEHSFHDTPTRKYSLCYWLNRIYEETWDELLGEHSVNDKVLVCTRRLFFFQKCTWIPVKNAAEIP